MFTLLHRHRLGRIPCTSYFSSLAHLDFNLNLTFMRNEYVKYKYTRLSSIPLREVEQSVNVCNR